MLMKIQLLKYQNCLYFNCARNLLDDYTHLFYKTCTYIDIIHSLWYMQLTYIHTYNCCMQSYSLCILFWNCQLHSQLFCCSFFTNLTDIIVVSNTLCICNHIAMHSITTLNILLSSLQCLLCIRSVSRKILNTIELKFDCM